MSSFISVRPFYRSNKKNYAAKSFISGFSWVSVIIPIAEATGKCYSNVILIISSGASLVQLFRVVT